MTSTGCRPVWINCWVIVYKRTGCGFESRCQLNLKSGSLILWKKILFCGFGGIRTPNEPKILFLEKKNQKSCFEKIQKSCFEKSTLGTFLIFFMKLKQHKIVKVERNSFLVKNLVSRFSDQKRPNWAKTRLKILSVAYKLKISWTIFSGKNLFLRFWTERGLEFAQNKVFQVSWKVSASQPAFNWSKLTMKTLEQGVNYVQS